MKKIKRLAALLIMLCILATMLPQVAYAASTSDLTFSLNADGNSYSVTDCSGSASGSLTIPATYNGKPVTSIGSSAFWGCSSLTSIEIPDGVTSIGDRAFYYCSSLTNITIPDSVTSIGQLAFYNCSSLISITIPDSVTSIGFYAFYGCSSLTGIWVDSDNTAYCSDDCGVLYNKSKTTLIQAPAKGFSGAYTIPDSVTSIGAYAFSYCSSLTSITIPDSVTAIPDYAFQWCSSLTSITIPDSVTSIGYYAFRDCSSLTSITMPDSVTSIGSSAFSYCSSLTSITIPDSVTRIGYKAFYDCDNLISITLPDSVTSIGDEAFYDCSSLTCITIPESVTSIGSSAFYGCSSLTSVTIPDSVTAIPDYAFYNCDSLTSITIGNGVTSIGSYAFQGCSNLTSITIPDSVTSIGYSAFYNCSSLNAVYITDIAAWCNISFSGSSSNPLNYGKILYLNGELVTNLVIPDSVTSIPDYAFYNCSSLTSITLPDSVTSIGDYAFRECRSLTSITIPDSVTSIGKYAFYNCSSLTIITIPDSVTSIGSDAFEFCRSLTSITIPDGVTAIPDYAFFFCNSLTSITIPDSVTSIGKYAFYGCSSLQDIYYSTGENEWSSINIGSNNDALSIDKVHFYHEHDYTMIPVTIVDATCTEAGYIEYTCIYGETYREATKALGHDFSGKETVTEPSCTTAGYVMTQCTRCEEQIKTEDLEALGHDLSGKQTVTEPSCKTAGYVMTQCTRCEEQIKTEEFEALGHDFSGKETVTEPSCTTAGYIMTQCTRCEEQIKTEDLEALGHDFSGKETVVLDNCTKGGYLLIQCVRCEEQTRTEIPAGKHTMVVVPAVAATCTTDGNTIGSCCEICGHIGVVSKVVPATGHNYVDDVCTNCGETIPFILTDSQGNLIGSYETLADALEAAQEGQILSLQSDITEGDVILPSGVSLDLNGHSLIANSVLTYSSSAIIDTSEDVSGLLKITEADGNMISKDNAQLPVYDSAAGGYRFFAIDVEPCAVTGGNKYWFKIKAEKFAPLYDLINADADVQIKAKMTWDGQETETVAVADLSFTKAWADRYNANEDVYITVTVNGAEAAENFKLIPIITSAGVEIPGEEM